LLTLESNRELCEMLPWVDEIVGLKISKFGAFLKSLRQSVQTIRRQEPDVLLNLEFLTNFSALVALLCTLFKPKKTVVGFSSPYRWRNSINDINVCFDHSRHIIKTFAKVITSLTGTSFEPTLENVRSAMQEGLDHGYFNRLVAGHQVLSECKVFICVNINAGELNLLRRWPAQNFSVVVKELLQDPQTAVLLIGMKDDQEYVSEFIKMLPDQDRVVDLCGRTSLQELLGLFCGSTLLLTNDGGPLHFAAAVGLPTVSLFGPETPYLYGPLDDKHVVFYEDLFCSPCLTIYNSKKHSCVDNLCLQAIKPEKVLEVIKREFLMPEKTTGADKS